MRPPAPSPACEPLMLRLVAPRWSSSLEQRLRALEPGGILLGGPLPHSPETLYELLGSVSRSLPTPPILALESAGGAEALNALLPPMPSPRALAQKGARLTHQAGELIGEALKLLGFNTYFALAFDLASTRAEEPQCASTFSADPRVVAECGASFVEGLWRHRILTCAKHFPGLASVQLDTPGELPISRRSMAGLWHADLMPYRALLPRLPLVLMSAAAYQAYDFDYPQPAALSAQVVEGLLRAKLGYHGVVVAPQLESQTVRGALDIGRAAVQSLAAGCDMLLVEKDESWQAMRHEIEKAIATGELPRERLERSAARIRAAKKGWSPPKGAFSKKSWERLARRFREFNSGG